MFYKLFNSFFGFREKKMKLATFHFSQKLQQFLTPHTFTTCSIIDLNASAF